MKVYSDRNLNSLMKSAMKTAVVAYTSLLSFAGLEHGIGEILQGNIKPESMFIQSWPDNTHYEALSGEPAFTVIPDLLVSGILTVLMSLIFLTLVIRYYHSFNITWIIIGSSIILFLVGGGFGPPLIGIILGLSMSRYMKKISAGVVKNGESGKSWRIWLVFGISSYLVLFPGLVILSYIISPIPDIIVIIFSLLAFSSLFVTLVLSARYDLSNQE